MQRILKIWFPIFLLPCVYALISLPLNAQDMGHSFVRLGVDRGLVSAEVRAIWQDRLGFIWIGTADGLDMHDGYGFTHYRHQPFDSTSLSASATTALCEDRNGTLWVGTVHGLCRMNAQERAAGRFQEFLHDPADSTSLSANAISAICEDAAGNLWIATYQGGLNRFDQTNGTFKHYRREPGNPYALNDDHVLALHRDRAGVLWVGTGNGGLKKFDAVTERFTTFTWQHPDYRAAYEEYAPSVFNFIDSLMVAQTPLAAVLQIGDAEERTENFSILESGPVLVIATGEAFKPPMADYAWLQRAGEDKAVWHMSHARSRHAGGAIKNRLAIAIVSLRPGAYTLHYRSDDSHSPQKWNAWPPRQPGLWGAQVFRLDAASAGRIAPLLRQSHRRSALSHPRVHAISDDPQPGSRALWIATAHGLNRFDTATETFTHYLQEPENPGTPNANYITALAANDSGGLWIASNAGLDYVDTKSRRFVRAHPAGETGQRPRGHVHALWADRSGILWVGTQGEGLYKLVPRKFSHHLLPEGESSHQIFSIYRDKADRLWLGTATGLMRGDRNSAHTLHFKHDPENPGSLSAGAVTFIHEDQTGRFWIGTWGGGLNRFAPATGKFVHYRHHPRDPASLSSDILQCMAADRDGSLWIGTAGGLNRFDPHTGRVQRFLHDPRDPRTIPSNDVFTLFVDRRGVLWVGTALGGLSKIDPATGACQNYIHDPDDRRSLANRTVNALHEDRAGTLWIGTYSGGLCALQRDEKGAETFTNYTMDDGLPSNKIQSILEDGDGRLWLSTNNGVARFDPRHKSFRPYTVQDGLQHAQFHRNSACRGAAGEMFFGGNNGFNSFFPSRLRDDPRAAPVILTQFKKFDRMQRFDRPLAAVEAIALPHDENFFSFEYVALDYAGAENLQYAYKLEGLESEWTHCGNRRFAAYTNVDPGEYVFRVRAANHDGIWSEQGASVKLVIAPPFWRTWWFYLASISAALLAALALHERRVRAKVKKLLELQNVRLAEREKVREQIARDYHDEMGHKITKIGLFSELIRRNTNGLATELQDHLDKVLEASQSLSLEARDFIWALNPDKDSLYETCLHLQEFGSNLFEETEENFQLKGLSDDLLRLKLTTEWKRHLTLLFKESMNNALKHARCKNVTLEVSVQNGILRMSLMDDGIGFSKVFGAQRNGNGAGLENMKRRAQLLHGLLEIHSPEGQGTRIHFSSALPTNGY